MKKKRNIKARLISIKENDRSFDLEFWQEAGTEAIFTAAWQMVRDMYAIRGKDESELRFQRSVEKIQRLQG